MARLLTVLFVIVSVVPSAAQSAFAKATADKNWPQFRGSRGGVAADDPRLPETWSTTENVAWSVTIPGRSWSSPVV